MIKVSFQKQLSQSIFSVRRITKLLADLKITAKVWSVLHSFLVASFPLWLSWTALRKKRGNCLFTSCSDKFLLFFAITESLSATRSDRLSLLFCSFRLEQMRISLSLINYTSRWSKGVLARISIEILNSWTAQYFAEHVNAINRYMV